MDNKLCFCGNPDHPTDQKCTSCKAKFHSNCIKQPQQFKFVECPPCQLKTQDLMIKVTEYILEPKFITFKPKTDFKKVFQFSFSKEKILKTIKSSKDINFFIILRCIRIDSIGYEHHWPLNHNITLNDIVLSKQKQPPLPLLSKPRDDYPIVFNPYKGNTQKSYWNKCHYFSIDLLKPENQLKFDCLYTENENDNFSYCFSLDLVQSTPINEFESNLKILKSKKDFEKFIFLHEDEVPIESEIIKLSDLFDINKRISLPVRGYECRHIGVFDFYNWYNINTSCRKWNCPICKKKSTRLYVDGKLLDLIRENLQCMEVEFNHKNKDFKPIEKAEQNRKINDVINLEDSDCENFNNSGKNKKIQFIQNNQSLPSMNSILMADNGLNSQLPGQNIYYGNVIHHNIITNQKDKNSQIFQIKKGSIVENSKKAKLNQNLNNFVKKGFTNLLMEQYDLQFEIKKKHFQNIINNEATFTISKDEDNLVFKNFLKEYLKETPEYYDKHQFLLKKRKQ